MVSPDAAEGFKEQFTHEYKYSVELLIPIPVEMF